MLLVFDCDGVVLDSMNLHIEVEAEAYGKLGIHIEPQEMMRRFSGYLQTEISEILTQETGIEVPADFDVRINELKLELFKQKLKPIPGIREALAELEDMPRCIASGTMTPLLDASLQCVDLYDAFTPHIYSADLVSKGKPAPDLFLYSAKKVGVPPAQCLVIEDGVPGILAAKAAGMRSVGFVGGSHCNETYGPRLKSAGAEVIFSDMRELPEIVKKISA